VPGATLLELNRASSLLVSAGDPRELRAVVAAARVGPDLHDWRPLRELQALLPDGMGWAIDRILWNAGVRTLTELLEDKAVWRTLGRRFSSEELEALHEGLRTLIAGAIATRRRDATLDAVAASHAERVDPPTVACPREQLEAWAALMGVEELAESPVVAALNDCGEPDVQVFVRRQGRSGLTVGAVVAGPTWPTLAERGRRDGAPLAIQELCLQWLVRGAAAREVAAGDEQERCAILTQTAPDVASLAAQDTALRSLRTHLRETVPAPLALDQAPARVRVLDEPRRIEVQLGRAEAPGCRKDPRLTIALDTGAARAEISCACSVGPSSCASALRAVDAALDLLRAPGAQRDALQGLLERPQWHAALAELEGLAEQSQRLARAPVLGWRIEADGIDTAILAVGVTALKSGGFRTKKLDDAELVEALDASEDLHDARVAGFAGAPAAARHALHRRARVRFALRELVGHPRVFLGARARDPIDVGLSQVAVVVDRRNGSLQMRLEADGQRLDAAALRGLSDQRDLAGPPFLIGRGRISVLAAAPELGRLATLLLRNGAKLDEAATEPILEALHRLERAVPVELDATLRGESTPADDRLLVRLELRSQGSLALSMRCRPLSGGPILRPGAGRRFVHASGDTQRHHIRRDLPAEQRRVTDLARVLGLDDIEDGVLDWLVVDPREAAEVVARLEGLAEESGGPVVEWTGRPMRFTTATGRSMSVGVRSMEQWFGLEGKLSVRGAEIPLDRLLELLEAGRRFVEVGDGDWVRIDEALARALEQAAAGAFLHRGKRVISPLHAPSLEGLSAAGVRVEMAPDWSAARDRIRQSETLQWTVPQGFVGTLRGYQEQGAAWMARCAAWAPGCCLADDMGLGKTVQALALLGGRLDAGPILVVAPASVGFNWIREAATFLPALRPLVYRGPERAELLDALAPGDMLVTSWSLLARDAEPLSAVRFGTVIFDEAQAAKNPDSARSAAARGLNAAFRIGLTGTPVENRPEDLWALFAMLAPGLLGSREAFRRRYALPIGRGEEPPRAQLALLARPLLLRRLKSQVATELPPRLEVDVHVQLGVEERRLYDEVRNTGLAALAHTGKDSQLRFQALALLTRLRQAACHPRLVVHDSDVRSAKLTRVLHLIRELHDGGHKALLFSQFLGHLALVREALVEQGFVVRSIDGSTPMAKRQREIDAFQGGDGDVFLISLKAGGVGLNLTAASYVFHLDPWWNPAVEDQATDRAHRIGQDKPVTIYRFIARDTVEEGILAMHKAKRALVDELLAGSGTSASLNAQQILEMLGG